MKLGLHYWNFTIPGDPALIAATLGEMPASPTRRASRRSR